ncbi:unnamed protein product [Ceutorhynchus assimilis]|uniref:Cell division cycle protein 16 n=1 Tax=Ceutorhynchus assimilis TaxID=467358 RepID=A0A9N9MXB0_9CUCU|nr:unnamed protein product [Ceutorhynchus assimilis]
MKTGNKITEFIEKYRKLVHQYIDLHIYSSALFWADKVVTLTDNPRDVYWLAQCMFLQKQYHRAAFLLQSKNLDKTHILCTYLTVKCYHEANEYSEALKSINNSDINNIISNSTFPPSISEIEVNLFDDTPKYQALSSFLLLKGKILEAMDNRGLAADCYKQALHYDVHCFEAFELLIKYQMLNAAEEQDLLQSMPIAEQCTTEEAEIIRMLYESKLKKYHTPIVHITKTIPTVFINNKKVGSTPGCIKSLPSSPSLPDPNSISTPMVAQNNEKNARTRLSLGDNKMQIDMVENVAICKLQENLEMHVSQAEMFYYNCDYKNCINLTERILKKDPYHDGCLPIHISCLVELKQSIRLFSMAHTLVDLYPNMAISWFAVGCYYYIIGKSDYARRYLAKATCLDRLFGPAWLAYGHSFANENEHDQAMAAYFKASQLMKGCHLPLLYIGLECGLTNNVRLAEKFFQQAQNIAPEDPFILHEKGVICFQNHEYDRAEQHFREALEKIKRVKRGPIPATWTSLLNNLGHTCRKLKKYSEALDFHNQALLLHPRAASTISAIAYVHVLMENYDDAVDWFHKALSLKRDDTFSTTMLNYVIDQWADEKSPYEDCPEGIPDYQQLPNSQVSMEQSTPIDNSDQNMSLVSNQTRNDTVDMSVDM